MKYKVLSLFVIVALLLTGLTVQGVDIKANRYHQHLQAKKKEPCTNHGAEEFCTHLPLISIQTDGPMPYEYQSDENGNMLYDEFKNPINNEEFVSANIKYFDNIEENNHLDDIPTVESKGLTRIRGRSSRAYDKKNYYLKFKEDNLIDNNNVSLSGMTADSDWALHGPFLDKSLIRNYLCYNLAGEIMEYSPNVRFCELFLNGEYQGLYLIMEKIDYNKSGRVNLTKSDPKFSATSYIYKLDEGSSNGFYNLNTFMNYSGKLTPMNRLSENMEVVYPSSTLTFKQKEYIENDISKFEKALTSFDSADKKLGYPSFINVDSFVEYFVLSEFTMNTDAGRLSTYLYKDVRGKLGIIPWDFDSSFNNYLLDVSDPQYFVMTNKYIYLQLVKDKKFVSKVVNKYEKLRKTYLSDEYLLNYIDETIEFLGPAIERNNAKWGYSFEPSEDLLVGEGRNPRSYNEAVLSLKSEIVDRGIYMDKNINTLYSLSHDSVNKKFRHGEGENK